MTRPLPALFALLLAGCASSYDLTLMPRNSGTIYKGEAFRAASATETQVTIDIDGKRYSGNWVLAESDRTTSNVSVGFGWGWRRGGIGIGTPVVVDAPPTEAKALLRAADGSGLRCDLRGISGGHGTGTCQDDKGLIYDVQIRIR